MKNKKENWNVCLCGMHLLKEDNLIDTVYPCNKERTVFNAYCNVSMGGCGRTVYSDNIDTLLKRWNMGVIDETEDEPVFCCGQNIVEAISFFNKNKSLNPELMHGLPLQINFLKDECKTCLHKN